MSQNICRLSVGEGHSRIRKQRLTYIKTNGQIVSYAHLVNKTHKLSQYLIFGRLSDLTLKNYIHISTSLIMFDLCMQIQLLVLKATHWRYSLKITWDILILESLHKSPWSSPISHMPPVKQDRNSKAHCKMLSIMMATDRVSLERKHLRRSSSLLTDNLFPFFLIDVNI